MATLSCGTRWLGQRVMREAKYPVRAIVFLDSRRQFDLRQLSPSAAVRWVRRCSLAFFCRVDCSRTCRRGVALELRAAEVITLSARRAASATIATTSSSEFATGRPYCSSDDCEGRRRASWKPSSRVFPASSAKSAELSGIRPGRCGDCRVRSIGCWEVSDDGRCRVDREWSAIHGSVSCIAVVH